MVKRTIPSALIAVAIAALIQIFSLCGMRSAACAADAGATPVDAVYQFVKESGGTTPKGKSVVLLGFEPGGGAFLYATQPGERLAFHGSWSYSGGNLKLAFTSEGLKVDANFPLRLSDARVTMPFQVFAGKPGTSDWTRVPLSVETGLFAVYDAALADDSLAMAPAQAADRARTYALGRIRAAPKARADEPRSEDRVARYSFGIPSAHADTPSGYCDNPDLVSVDVIDPSDLLVTYACKPDGHLVTSEIMLNPQWGWNGGAPLRKAPLAGDPRVFIDVFRPHNAKWDPSSKDAIIIAPFMNGAPLVGLPVIDRKDLMGVGGKGVGATVAPKPELFAIEPALEGQGYSVTIRYNQNATLVGIARALIAHPHPGWLEWEGHGDERGGLSTYDLSDMGAGNSAAAVLARFGQFIDSLPADLADLKTFGAKPGSKVPATFTTGSVEQEEGNPLSAVPTLGITPLFWQWLIQKRGVDFHRSLVFINACATDQSPTLRNTFQAGAYFAWNHDVWPQLSTAVAKYLAGSLIRPTHSAEETYYNLMRVARTRQMIYVEDKLLDGSIGDAEDTKPAQKGDADLDKILKGYAWDGSKMVDYNSAGWLAGHMNAGQIWWLLYAARWSQNTAEGKQKLLNCWSEIWQPRKSALDSPQCNAYDNGSIPKQDEVSYAIFLLTGEQGLGAPRWTLNDGGS